MIRIKHTSVIRGLTERQLVWLAEWMDLNEIYYDVIQNRKNRSYYDVTIPREDKSTALVVLARCKKEYMK